MIDQADDFFAQGCGRCERFATPECSTRRWSGGLAELRRICLGAGLVETVKWGHPCYVHSGRNIVILGAFRADFRISFFDAALMQDPEGILERQGPNTRHPDAIRFTENAQVARMEPTLVAYLGEAAGYAEAGIRPPKERRDVELPDELVEALSADPELGDAFHRLTPGRQRSWAFHVGGAKQSKTRVARIARARDRILAGKGANER